MSYAFDDLHALYLRGQWTVHRNDPPVINQVWRQCAHLGSDLQKELAYKVTYLRQMEASGRRELRLASAEARREEEQPRQRQRPTRAA